MAILGSTMPEGERPSRSTNRPYGGEGDLAVHRYLMRGTLVTTSEGVGSEVNCQPAGRSYGRSIGGCRVVAGPRR